MVLFQVVVQESRLRAALPSLTCDFQGQLGVAASVTQKGKRACQRNECRVFIGQAWKDSHKFLLTLHSLPLSHMITLNRKEPGKGNLCVCSGRKGKHRFCRIAVFATTSKARELCTLISDRLNNEIVATWDTSTFLGDSRPSSIF